MSISFVVVFLFSAILSAFAIRFSLILLSIHLPIVYPKTKSRAKPNANNAGLNFWGTFIFRSLGKSSENKFGHVNALIHFFAFRFLIIYGAVSMAAVVNKIADVPRFDFL